MLSERRGECPANCRYAYIQETPSSACKRVRLNPELAAASLWTCTRAQDTALHTCSKGWLSQMIETKGREWVRRISAATLLYLRAFAYHFAVIQQPGQINSVNLHSVFMGQLPGSRLSL